MTGRLPIERLIELSQVSASVALNEESAAEIRAMAIELINRREADRQLAEDARPRNVRYSGMPRRRR